MKRIFLSVVSAIMLAVPAVQAQKINRDAFIQKIEKSNAEIVDAKKNTKAATWINRGKLYAEAAVEPTKNLFVNLEAPMLKITCGEPRSIEEVILPSGAAYTVWNYEWFKGYIRDGKLIAWTQTGDIVDNAVTEALKAYAKAYEIDPKQAAKIKTGLDQLYNFCSQEGNISMDLGEHRRAAEAYTLAYETQMQPAYAAAGGKAEPALLYYAGYLLTADGPNNPESYVKGAEMLGRSLDAGYVDEEGNLYYYLFHCYFGQASAAEGDAKVALLNKAKSALVEGVGKYPNNERIIESFMVLYTNEKSMGDTAELIDLIKGAIERDPQSVDMWSSLGLVYYTIKDYDNAIAAGLKVVTELAPDSFDNAYRLGVYYAAKGDAIRQEMSTKDYTSNSQFDADLAASNEAYALALPWLEKAHEKQPGNKALVETLKQICYALRDTPGIQAKYDQYNTLFQQM